MVNRERRDELVIAKRALAFEIKEKGKRASELAIANKELLFQTKEKAKRAAELVALNKSLAAQIEEKENLAAELISINSELSFQNQEKRKRAAELVIANKKLLFENKEKEKRASELAIANADLMFQNLEKGRRAAELIVANAELEFQNEEKERRAAELIVANKKLLFQNQEKEKRAAELVVQHQEKEKRAAELVIANIELLYQNGEKEKRAAELVIANKELAFQNKEKEKRAAELIIINSELKAFSYVSSHDLQEPLRKIQIYSKRIIELDQEHLSEKGKEYFIRMQSAAARMRMLIEDLLAFSRLSVAERVFEDIDLDILIAQVKEELKDTIDEKQLTINSTGSCKLRIIPFQFRQVLHNLIGNALKFSKPGLAPHIEIRSRIVKGGDIIEHSLLSGSDYCHIAFSDNGIGFDPENKDRIFEVFQRLHGLHEYPGSGIGLAIVKKVVDNHGGLITATGELNKGATFNIYIPVG